MNVSPGKLKVIIQCGWLRGSHAWGDDLRHYTLLVFPPFIRVKNLR
jgi:hypothetical protein